MTTAPALTPERLHARFESKIRRHVYAVLGADHDRDDLVHEVLMTVFRKIDTLRNPECLDGWVAQVTSNTLKYAMRQRRLRRHASWEALSEPEAPSFHSDYVGHELAARAMRVMSSLPSSDRALLATYWFSTATAESIAEERGCSVITVRRRLLRARTRFEKLARRDPALAIRIERAREESRRFRLAPRNLRGRAGFPQENSALPSS
ncbi:MAG TPA: sigma-70 family RNA polymerase sigma factor [Polyangiaceae bacterium]